MNLPVKILLIHLAAILVIIVLLAVGTTFTVEDFGFSLGMISVIVGGIDLLIALILFLVGKSTHVHAQGFLLSAGVLLLLGFATCSVMFRTH